MRKIGPRLLMLVLVLSLVGCADKGSNTGAGTAPSGKADYAVKVTVEPASATVPDSGRLTVVFTFSNEGKNADTYDLETGDEFFGKKAIGEGVPATMTLQAGESKDLTIPLTFEVKGSVAAEFDVSITAISQGDPAIKDMAACTISFE
jgi:uncharacterized membrane protein